MAGNTGPETLPPDRDRALLRRGWVLEGATLGWNVVGIVPAIAAIAAIAARSVALAGFGLDSLNAAAGLWWADPLAALVIVFYALREAREIFLPGLLAPRGTAVMQDPP